MPTLHRTPLMAGNWKMNCDHREAVGLVQKLAWKLDDRHHDFATVEVAVLPPFTDLRSVQTMIDGDELGLVLGAQDLSEHDSGAYTGEVSGAMLARLGCRYVTVGHSERREHHAESDATVAAKAVAAGRHGLVPIVCVGESLDVRREGRHVAFVLEQLTGSLAGLDPPGLATSDQSRVVIAYEPVWAIGTGEVATPADAQEVCGAIRAWLSQTFGAEVAAAVRILYGGSVKAANVAAVMAGPDIDGALVGGASLDPAEFGAIVRYAELPVLPA